MAYPRPAITGRGEATLLLGGPIAGQAPPSRCREQEPQGASRMQREGDWDATQGAREQQRAKEGANESQAEGANLGERWRRRRSACGFQQMNGCSAGSCWTAMPVAQCQQSTGLAAGPRSGRTHAAERQAPAEQAKAGLAVGGCCWRGCWLPGGRAAGAPRAGGGRHPWPPALPSRRRPRRRHARRQVAHEPQLLPRGLLAAKLSCQGGPHIGHEAVPKVVAAAGVGDRAAAGAGLLRAAAAHARRFGCDLPCSREGSWNGQAGAAWQ